MFKSFSLLFSSSISLSISSFLPRKTGLASKNLPSCFIVFFALSSFFLALDVPFHKPYNAGCLFWGTENFHILDKIPLFLPLFFKSDYFNYRRFLKNINRKLPLPYISYFSIFMNSSTML